MLLLKVLRAKDSSKAKQHYRQNPILFIFDLGIELRASLRVGLAGSSPPPTHAATCGLLLLLTLANMPIYKKLNKYAHHYTFESFYQYPGHTPKLIPNLLQIPTPSPLALLLCPTPKPISSFPLSPTF